MWGKGRPPKSAGFSPMFHLLVSLTRKSWGEGGSSYDTLVCLLIERLAGNFIGALATGQQLRLGGRQLSGLQSCMLLGISKIDVLSSKHCLFLVPLFRGLFSPFLSGIKESDPLSSLLLGDDSHLESLLLKDSPPIEGPGTVGSCGFTTSCSPSSHFVVSIPSWDNESKSASKKFVAMPTTSPGDGFKFPIPTGIPWALQALDLSSLHLYL